MHRNHWRQCILTHCSPAKGSEGALISLCVVTSCLTKVINSSPGYLHIESKSLAQLITLSKGTFGLNLKTNRESATSLAISFLELIILIVQKLSLISYLNSVISTCRRDHSCICLYWVWDHFLMLFFSKSIYELQPHAPPIISDSQITLGSHIFSCL